MFQLFLTTHNPRLRLFRGVLLGTAVAILMGLLLNGDYFSTSRTGLQDALYSPGKTSGITAIIAIDNASLAALGRSTVFWDRRAHADMVNILTEAKAKVIAFDIVFAEPTEQDDALAAALESASKGKPGERLPIPVVQAMAAEDLALTEPSQQYVYPTTAFADKGVLGHVNVLPDSDGVVRSYPLAIYDPEGQLVPALGLAAELAYLRFPRNQVVYNNNSVVFAGRTIPTSEYRQMLVYYFGEPSTDDTTSQAYPVYSYIDVLCAYQPNADYYLPGFSCADRPNPVDVPLDLLTDKIVLIGVLGATADPDHYPVPISKDVQMFGVEIHANVIETLHQAHPEVRTAGRVLPPVEQPLNEKILVVVVLALLSGVILPFLRWYVSLILVPLVYLIYFAAAVIIFRSNGKLVELLFPALTLTLMLFGVLLITYLFEERRRNQINDLFQRYVSPDIARKIVEIADRGDLNLSGEEREITVMFADIRGFTTLSEGLSPREVVDLLNTFLEKMNEVVLANGGAINKYIGDNLMAFWNAPYPQDDHAWKAVQAGLGLLKVVDELNATGQFKSKVQFGIGVNTGQTVVGNIGSKQRLEYTPIGDTVNIASRLSGKAPGGSMLVGEGTFSAIQGRLEPVGQDSLMLKGKTKPVIAYEYRADGKKRNVATEELTV